VETHGRWPLVGAAAAAPVTALAIKRTELRPLAGLLWHQTEEWVWPGGFLPWINREVIGSGEDEFPLDRRLGFAINVIFGWGFSVATIRGAAAAAPSTLLYVSHLGNTVFHVSWAIRNRRYDPGTITSIATLAPVGVMGLRGLARDPAVSRRAMGAGIAAGAAMSVGLLPLMRRRAGRKAGEIRSEPAGP